MTHRSRRLVRLSVAVAALLAVVSVEGSTQTIGPAPEVDTTPVMRPGVFWAFRFAGDPTGMIRCSSSCPVTGGTCCQVLPN